MSDLGAENVDNRVVVIGAGIVGVSTALAIQSRGISVTIIERSGVAAEASYGNAGAFAFSDIMPLASPGIMGKAPGWLLDPLGPLSIPPSYAPRIAPWMVRFWLASQPRRAAAGMAAQAALNNLSRDRLPTLARNTGTETLLRNEGQLELYDTEAAHERSLPGWQVRADHGIAFDHIHGVDAIAEIQPGIDRRFTVATFTPQWMSVTDPADFTRALAEVFVQRGGVIDLTEAKAVSASSDSALVQLADGRSLRAGAAIICAGAWSHRLARTMGDSIPLETERGYNTTLPVGAFNLRTQLTFGGHGFVVTRVTGGIRVGGAVELGGLDLPPNYRRSSAMLEKAKSFLPDLRTDGGEQWMGFRPSLPDSLPVIGHARSSRRVLYAFGHGHLGLTQAVGTAALVSALIAGETVPIDMKPYAPGRF